MDPHCLCERFYISHCLYPVPTSISDQNDFTVAKYRGFFLSSEKNKCQAIIGGIRQTMARQQSLYADLPECAEVLIKTNT